MGGGGEAFAKGTTYDSAGPPSSPPTGLSVWNLDLEDQAASLQVHIIKLYRPDGA